MKFEKRVEEFTVKQLIAFNKKGKLNLNPGFQRLSVWRPKQQIELVETLLLGMPIPNMFFWEHKEGNKLVYDVIDGKQRMEAILAFVRSNKPIAVPINPEEDPDWNYDKPNRWTWKNVKDEAPKKAKAFEAYLVPVVIVSGDLKDIEKLFVKINSSGSKLTKQEILNARWHRTSKLLSAAKEIDDSYSDYFEELKILSRGQITRMKSIELIAELLLSMEGDKVLNKKDALNSVMRNENIHTATLRKLSKELKSILGFIKKTFPDIRTTRFKKLSDFYALTFTLWRMKKDGYVLSNKQRSELAFTLLKRLSFDIAKGRENFDAGKGGKLKSPAREYQSTVISGSDSAPKRKRRVEIIESLIQPVFATKDSKRAFTDNQKQLLWHSSSVRKCSFCGDDIHGWDDVEVDHITAHSKGGATRAKNAQLLHSRCNKRKSAK